MERGKELAKNTMILTVGKISTQLITFLLLPLYTGVLSTEEYGLIDLISTLVMVVTPIISLQIDQGTFRMLVDNRDSDERKYEIITNAMVSSILGVAVFLGIGLPLVAALGITQWHFFIWIVVATVESNLFLQIARGVDKTSEYALASFIIASSTIAFNIVFLIYMKLGVSGMLLGTLLGHVIGFVYLWLKLRLRKYIRLLQLKKNTVAHLLKYSVPLVPSSISWWIFNSSDRIIVTAVLGLSMNGILSASNKFSAAVVAVYNIFVLSWTESICIHINDRDIQDYFNRIFNMVLKVFFSIGLILAAIMPFAYTVMVNYRYSGGYVLVPLHLVAALLNIILGLSGAVYIAKSDTKTVAVTSVFSAVINIIVHFLLINSIGLFASPVSTIAALVIMVLVRNKDIGKKYFKISYDKKMMFLMFFGWMMVLILYYQDNLILHLAGVVFSFAIAIGMCREVIKTVICEIKRYVRKDK